MTDGRILKDFADNEIVYKTEYGLKDSLSFRVPSMAMLAVFPDTEEKLCFAVLLLKENGVPFEIIGNGSNLLFATDFYNGAVIFTKRISSVRVEQNIICASAGVSFSALASLAARESLSGLEFAYGIPATVGGAVYMNAGAYGGAVSDILLDSTCFDGEKIVTVSAKEHEFGYRKSVYMRGGLVCLGARFALNAGNREDIESKMRENMSARREKQPLEYASAGSYFKRPKGYFAGKLIEDCGLKGFSVGGAVISPKHAGFIINTGNATHEDIITLEDIVRKRVFERFGVLLEREVRIIK